MNILIIPSWFPTEENPINGIFFLEQAYELNNYAKSIKENLNITILIIRTFSILNLIEYVKFKNNEKYENGVFINTKKILKIPKVNLLHYFRCGLLINKFLDNLSNNNRKISAVHIHSTLDAAIWYYFSKKIIPYIITEHASAFSRNLIKKSKLRYVKKSLDSANVVFAVSNGLRNDLLKITSNKVGTLYNIVKRTELNIIETSNHKYFTFLSIGVNSYVKGYDILIEAFSVFLQTDNAYLTIAGLTYKEITELNKDLEKFNIKQSVTLLGLLSREDVFSLMNNCDCFILSSRYETFGIVLAEAMYCGKPVIATKTGGPDSFINEDVGIVVDVGDIQQTASAMLKIKMNYDKYDHNNIIKYANNNFSSEIICKKLLEAYKKVLA